MLDLLRPACLLLLLSILAAAGAVAEPKVGPAQVGPAKGTLVIVGGGDEILPILEYFIELAGGKEAPIVVIPTAGGASGYDDKYYAMQWFRDLGAKNVVILHTDDRTVADSEAFTQPIRQASGVWMPGGRQWRLADSYLDTRTQSEIEAVLARGGVVGGSSAGATIQGSYLARGDTQTNTVMMGDHERGFGLLRNVAIDQHLLKRNRQFDLLEIVQARPELLGIGLDENTGIVVTGDRFSVMGPGYVAIYDPRRKLSNGGSFYLLAAGDQFDLASRTPERPKEPQEFERLFAEQP
jgi:cyanophycinase